MRNVNVQSQARARHALGLALLLLGTSLMACGDCSDETAAADRFIEDPTHRTCQSDADCSVVSTGCNDVSRGLCGQAPLSSVAAASEEWLALSQDLNDCDDGSCEKCAALLLPRCLEGFCGGP